MKRRVRERVVGVSAEDDVEAVDEVGRELIVVCHWPSSQAPAKFEPPHMSHTCHVPDLPFLFILILIFIMFFFYFSLEGKKKENGLVIRSFLFVAMLDAGVRQGGVVI